MVRVEFLGPIEKDPIELEVSNVNQLKEILNKDKDLKEWLSECAVAVNERIISSSDYELKDGDKVVLLPPVCGG
ncbi:MAG: MoaD/ThiS family protein [Epsilonproteobacteria bacterium]|nr:MoaD/ThiS family protein [Campylobacterota bacterium]